MTVINLTEHGTSQSVLLADAAGRALAESRFVDAEPDSAAAGWWRIKPKGIVGTATIQVPNCDAISLRIRPKIPIGRLLFLLEYSRNPKGWQTEDVLVDEERELLPAFARFFVVQANRALRQGLLRGYRSIDETALLLRGRINHAEQLRKHHGEFIPLEITYDEYTSDITENRLLRAATEVLIRLPNGVSADVRRKLFRLRLRLADIASISRGQTLPKWQPSRLNTRYHPALRLAELALRDISIESRPGSIVVNGFLFDMAKVFEDFVTVALREALVNHSGYCVLQAAHHLDERNAIRMIPDFVHYASNGTPLAVADAKYKAEKPNGFPEADLYQMVAYCTSLNLKEGHLIYAKGNTSSGSHRVKNVNLTIHQHALELNQKPTKLIKDVQALANRISTPQ